MYLGTLLMYLCTYYLQIVQNMSLYKRRGSGWQTKSIENLLIIWKFRVSYMTHQDFKCSPRHWVWITWRCQDRNSKIKFPKISEFCGLCDISQVFFLKVKKSFYRLEFWQTHKLGTYQLISPTFYHWSQDFYFTVAFKLLQSYCSQYAKKPKVTSFIA